MSVNSAVRKNELELISAFLQPEVDSSPKTTLIYGNPSTGKSTMVSHHLQSIKVKFSWIQCDECLSLKILWKRIFQAIQIDSGLMKREDLVYDPLTTSSFQGFLKAIRDFVLDSEYDELHYLVLDRADMIMEGGETVFTNFIKFQEVTQIENLSIIFITTTLPKRIITAAIPTIFFENYDSEQTQALLESNVECHFPVDLGIQPSLERSFWENYSKLIIDSFFSYTTDIITLRKIARSLWDDFTKPIRDGELKANQFLNVYRRNFHLLSAESAVTDPALLEVENETNSISSNLPLVSKYILIAAYIASFNGPKQDWLLFSKLKEFRRSRKVNLSARKGKVSSKLVDGSSFDLERLFAITHAVYNIDSPTKLVSNVDLTTQVANLSSLKLILKSSNQDFITARTKWKVNVNYDFIKKVSEEVSFPIEDYLIE